MSQAIATIEAGSKGPRTISWPPSIQSLSDSIPKDLAWQKAPTIERELTATERSWISTRIRELTSFARASFDGKATAGQLKLLFSLYPSNTAEQSAGNLAALYMVALADVPAWTVTATVSAIIAGTEPDVDPRFRPSPPELARMCRDKLVPVKAELWSLERLAAAVVATLPAWKPPTNYLTMEERIQRRADFERDQQPDPLPATMFVLETSPRWSELCSRYAREYGGRQVPAGQGGWSFPAAWVQEP